MMTNLSIQPSMSVVKGKYVWNGGYDLIKSSGHRNRFSEICRVIITPATATKVWHNRLKFRPAKVFQRLLEYAPERKGL